MGASTSRFGGGSLKQGDGYRYSVSYAPTSAATCRGCKETIAKGSLRMGRSMPNPFDAHGGHSDYTQHFHFEHAFAVFARSKHTSKVPTSVRDVTGLTDIRPEDRLRVREAVTAFATQRKREKKGT